MSSVLLDLLRELGGEPRLANSGIAEDCHQIGSRLGDDGGEETVERGERGGPSDHRYRAGFPLTGAGLDAYGEPCRDRCPLAFQNKRVDARYSTTARVAR